MGFWEAWQRFGRLQWKDLFEEAIKMCEDGFVIGEILGDEIIDEEFDDMASDPKNNMT